MSIASADEIQARVKRTLSSSEQAAAEAMIDDFQAELESILGRPMEPTDVVETRFLPVGWFELSLRQTPIISIASITIDGNALDASAWSRIPNGINFRTTGPTNALMPSPELVIVVSYRAGLDAPKNAPAKSIITSRVVRALNSRADESEGATSVAVEDYKIAYVDDGFTEAEMRAVSRLRRRVIV